MGEGENMEKHYMAWRFLLVVGWRSNHPTTMRLVGYNWNESNL
jgi:hypothetical protein